MSEYRHFQLSEFDSADEPGSGARKMDRDFVRRLDNAREDAKIPFVINSGYRTKDHNKSVGGKRNSSHLKGLAADIATNGSRDRYLILRALIRQGFTRIGIAENFIHVDCDTSKDPRVLWLY